jgi:hypothetical protein
MTLLLVSPLFTRLSGTRRRSCEKGAEDSRIRGFPEKNNGIFNK